MNELPLNDASETNLESISLGWTILDQYSEPAHSHIPALTSSAVADPGRTSEPVRGKVLNLRIQLYLEVLKRDF